MIQSTEFTYSGHRVEIVQPDISSASTGKSRLTASSSATFCLTQRERRRTKRRSLSSGKKSTLCLTRDLRKMSPASHDLHPPALLWTLIIENGFASGVGQRYAWKETGTEDCLWMAPCCMNGKTSKRKRSSPVFVLGSYILLTLRMVLQDANSV